MFKQSIIDSYVISLDIGDKQVFVSTSGCRFNFFAAYVGESGHEQT